MSEQSVKKTISDLNISECSKDKFFSEGKCKGCPFGYIQYCVGICWKDVYKGYLRKRERPDNG